MAYTNPQVSDFQAQFFRDFPFGSDPKVSVLPTDITNAFNFVTYAINPGLWPDQTSYNLGYLLLAAHYLVLNLRASSQGINGQYNWAQNSKTMGPATEAFEIPERVKQNPELMMLTKTQYGAQYLQLILPQICGQMFSVCGRSKP